MTDRAATGNQQDTRQAADRPTTVPVADAARRLGISPDAVRGRLQRGTLAGEKIAGVWRVAASALPADTAPTGPSPVDRQDTTGQRQDTDRPSESALIEHLRSENDYLRAELSARSRELAAERERADVLMREALGRIEALTVGQGENLRKPEISDVGEHAPQRPQDGPHATTAGDVEDEASPWWRRWWRALTGESR